MNGLRKFLCFVLAIGLGAFALSGIAAAPSSNGSYQLFLDEHRSTYVWNSLASDGQDKEH